MKWLGRGTFVAVILGVSSCSDSSSAGGAAACASKGSCPNSPPPQQTSITRCQSLVGDPKCGALFCADFSVKQRHKHSAHLRLQDIFQEFQ